MGEMGVEFGGWGLVGVGWSVELGLGFCTWVWEVSGLCRPLAQVPGALALLPGPGIPGAPAPFRLGGGKNKTKQLLPKWGENRNRTAKGGWTGFVKVVSHCDRILGTLAEACHFGHLGHLLGIL